MPEFNLKEITKGVTEREGFQPESIFDPGHGLNPGTVRPEPVYTKLVMFFFYAIGVIAFLVLIYAGISYMTAGADAEKADRAKKMIIGAVIGLIIIVTSYTVYNTTIDIIKTGDTSKTGVIREGTGGS